MAATDTYDLYDLRMSGTEGCGITRSGETGAYAYSAAADFVNRPVNYVSFWDAIRFSNWLHNGQPAGMQGTSTTEDGAYAINGYEGEDGRWIHRNPGAKWFLPSEDEWYKAAFYKGGGTDAGYWDYPTQSDTAPGQDMSDASGNNANYYTAPFVFPIDSGKYTTIVGEFQNSEGPYGTFDQGGNVFEWNDTVVIQGSDYASRGVRGGSFNDGYYVPVLLSAAARDWVHPTCADLVTGFRVAQAVPEPSSFMALAGGFGMLLGLRRRRV